MSLTSSCTSEESSKGNDNSMAIYLPLGEYSNYALYCIKTMFANIQQVKTNVHAQYQHEKHELIQLNERLSFFIDRVQQLELQNAKYAAILADFRQKPSSINISGTEMDERHVHLQTDLMTVNYKKINYEFEFEVFQMHSEIYKQLIHVINQSNDNERLKLQQELDQSSSTLINLRTSYAELQKKIESVHAEREYTFQQYLKVTDNWGHCKKQISELKVNMQMLKNQHLFYKNIRSHVASGSFSVEIFDVEQFWALKWEKIIANIRHDYELLYASIHREIVAYYEMKMKEVQVEVEQAIVEHTKYYQEVEIKKLGIIQQTLQFQHEEMQQIYAYEKEMLIKLEATNSKFESEFESIQLQHSEGFEKQSKDLHILQESIITMVNNIEEMRRRKTSLESELIIYRHLLEIDEIQDVVINSSALVQRTVMDCSALVQCTAVDSSESVQRTAMDCSGLIQCTMLRTFVVESQKIGSIGIECSLDSTYIRLMNHSTSKAIDISRWMLTRRIDSKTELKYTLPDGIRLLAGGELKIYSKLGADAAQLSSNYGVVSSPLNQQLVTNNVVSWILGDKIETRLFDENGAEKASCIQTAES